MKHFLEFIFTQVSRITMLVIRFVLKLLYKIPLVDLALYIIADLCYFIFDKIFMTIGTFVCMVKGNGAVGRYWKMNAVLLDKKLNVSGQHLLNATMIKGDAPDYLKFGNQFSTISDQTGRLHKLTGFGYFIKDVFLDTIDKDHCAKAVQLNNKALLTRITELKLYDLN